MCVKDEMVEVRRVDLVVLNNSKHDGVSFEVDYQYKEMTALKSNLCDCSTFSTVKEFEVSFNAKLNDAMSYINCNQALPERHAFFKSKNCFFIKFGSDCFLVFRIAFGTKNLQVIDCIHENSLYD